MCLHSPHYTKMFLGRALCTMPWILKSLTGAVFLARDDLKNLTLGRMSHPRKWEFVYEFHLAPMKTVQQQLWTGEGRPTSKGWDAFLRLRIKIKIHFKSDSFASVYIIWEKITQRIWNGSWKVRTVFDFITGICFLLFHLKIALSG